MVPIEQKDQTEESASKTPQNHPLDPAKRQNYCRLWALTVSSGSYARFHAQAPVISSYLRTPVPGAVRIAKVIRVVWWPMLR